MRDHNFKSRSADCSRLLRNTPPRSSTRGFTLVELLVTITIIVVLAGLVFSVGGRIRSSALKTKEMNNIRSITQVVAVYASEHQRLPGPVNRGIKIPSTVAKASRPNFLSTFLIDAGLLGEDDTLWQTKPSTASDSQAATYIINSTVNSTPSYFFGRLQGGAIAPKPMPALRSNLKTTLGGKDSQDFSELWMICTGDDENYGSSPLISEPSATKSAWGGRFYAFFDGHVKFIKRQSPSIYPSSFSGGHQ